MGGILNTGRITIAAIILVVIAMAAASVYYDDADGTDVMPFDALHADNGITYVVQPDKTYDIIILGSDASADELLNRFGSIPGNIISTEPVSDDKKHLAIMTEDWIRSNNDAATRFNGFLEAGDASALFNTDIDWDAIDYPVSYPLDTPAVFAMTVDGEMSYCFSRPGSSTDAIGDLITWADSKLVENSEDSCGSE